MNLESVQKYKSISYSNYQLEYGVFEVANCNLKETNKQKIINLRSQFATSSLGKHRGMRYFPFAFTEHGIAMLSSILKSSIPSGHKL